MAFNWLSTDLDILQTLSGKILLIKNSLEIWKYTTTFLKSDWLYFLWYVMNAGID